MEPKMNGFKNEIKMDLNDINMLKLLLNDYDSIYSFISEYKKINQISTTTIRRRINKLEKFGLIKKQIKDISNENKDKRGAEKLSLTDYGIATLIVKSENLDENEMNLVLQKAYQNEPYNVEYFSQYIDSDVSEFLSNIFEFIKIRINLEYFNIDYFKNQLTLAYILYYIESAKKIIPKASKIKFSKKEMRKMLRMKNYYLEKNIDFFDKSIEFLSRKIKLYEDGKVTLENIKKAAQQALQI
jgi:DNA-binding Lrp family transcriptional regulator